MTMRVILKWPKFCNLLILIAQLKTLRKPDNKAPTTKMILDVENSKNSALYFRTCLLYTAVIIWYCKDEIENVYDIIQQHNA